MYYREENFSILTVVLIPSQGVWGSLLVWSDGLHNGECVCYVCKTKAVMTCGTTQANAARNRRNMRQVRLIFELFFVFCTFTNLLLLMPFSPVT